jgi:hypothetical protein
VKLADVELTVRQRALMVRFLVIQTVAILAILVMVVVTNYQGRSDVVNATRRNCEGGKVSLALLARSWRVQANADQGISEDPSQSPKTRSIRRADAAVHRRTAAELQARATRDCGKAFPMPPWFQLTI